MSLTLPRMDMSGLEWTPDVSMYRQPWRESTGACLQAPAGEGTMMTDRPGEIDVGTTVLGLMTIKEVAKLLRRPGRRCSVKKVNRLAAAGELTRVRLGALSRYTPESVAAYEQHQAAAAEVL